MWKSCASDIFEILGVPIERTLKSNSKIIEQKIFHYKFIENELTQNLKIQPNEDLRSLCLLVCTKIISNSNQIKKYVTNEYACPVIQVRDQNNNKAQQRGKKNNNSSSYVLIL